MRGVIVLNVVTKLIDLAEEFGFSENLFFDVDSFGNSKEPIGLIIDEVVERVTVYGFAGNSIGIIEDWDFFEISEESYFLEVFEGLFDHLMRIPKRLWMHELVDVLELGFREV